VVVIGLAGCSSPQDPAPVPSESTAVESTSVTSIDELSGTTWSGTDSDGDEITIVFNASGTPSIGTGGPIAQEPGDTWAVEGDTLTIVAFFGAPNGTVTYIGQLSDDGSIPLDYVASTSGATGELVLRQKL
jgi:hypothetical protein